VHVPPDALEFFQAGGRLFNRRLTIVKRPGDDKTVVMEELQVAGGVLRPDHGVDMVVAAPGSPEPLSGICRHHDTRNVTRRLNRPYPRAVRSLVLTAFGLSLTVLCASSALAQGIPSLAGSWRLDRDRTATLIASRTTTPAPQTAPAGGAVTADGGKFATLTAPIEDRQEQISQTSSAVTIDRTVGEEHQQYVYRLDGKEGTNTNINGRSILMTKSWWDGDRLVTEGTQHTMTDRGTVSNAFREIRSIDNTGAMVIETTRQFDAAGRSTSLQVLVKKAPETAASWYALGATMLDVKARR